MSPESIARSEQKSWQLAKGMPLHELRMARDLTQARLAEIMGVNQAAISKKERRADMAISTLRDFIRAVGGELEIKAIFPEGEVVIDQFCKERQKQGREPI
jgi:transcriptional regulator with XRE-family HTH domain